MVLFINEAVVTVGLGLVGLAGLAVVTLSIVISPAALSSPPDIVVVIVYGAGALAILATLEVVLVAFKAVSVSFLQVTNVWGVGFVSQESRRDLAGARSV